LCFARHLLCGIYFVSFASRHLSFGFTETTVTNNTMFHKTTKPLLIWFLAIWWMVAQKNGVSAKGLQKILGLGSYQTAWTWLHKFRRLMVLSGRSKLYGTVEVDEVLVGGKTPGQRGW